MLTKISGLTKERDGAGRNKTDDESDELIRRKNIINHVQAERLSWFGLLHGMAEERMAKKVCKWKPMSIRTQGRPKNRWEDNLRNDMKTLKIKNWISCIQVRNKWKSYVDKKNQLDVTFCILYFSSNS